LRLQKNAFQILFLLHYKAEPCKHRKTFFHIADSEYVAIILLAAAETSSLAPKAFFRFENGCFFCFLRMSEADELVLDLHKDLLDELSSNRKGRLVGNLKATQRDL